LYSTREGDLESYFKNVGNVIDVAVMRDKSSGRSRGFAFVTFQVYDVYNNGEDPMNCKAVKELNKKMLEPKEPHLIQNREVEIRQSDGSKP
jgi:hypothetical protein